MAEILASFKSETIETMPLIPTHELILKIYDDRFESKILPLL